MTTIVAEIGSNWVDLESALSMVDLAKEVGADCVKFQDFRVDAMNRPQEWKDANRRWENVPVQPLHQRAHELGIGFLCSVWDEVSLMQAMTYDYTAIKIASSEIINQDLLSLINDHYRRLPVWLSVPHDHQGYVIPALTWLNRCKVTLLHCVAQYPAESPQYKKYDQLKEFGLPVGFSSHLRYIWNDGQPGVIAKKRATHAAKWFVKNGAVVIEAHLRGHTTPKECPDSGAWSLQPSQFAEMIKAVRDVG